MRLYVMQLDAVQLVAATVSLLVKIERTGEDIMLNHYVGSVVVLKGALAICSDVNMRAMLLSFCRAPSTSDPAPPPPCARPSMRVLVRTLFPLDSLDNRRAGTNSAQWATPPP